jgi:hypothetical protein
VVSLPVFHRAKRLGLGWIIDLNEHLWGCVIVFDELIVEIGRVRGPCGGIWGG